MRSHSFERSCLAVLAAVAFAGPLANAANAALLPPPARVARPANAAARLQAAAPRLIGTVGSGNEADGDMPIPRPNTVPCTVQLFKDVRFADFSPKPFSYAPPAACPFPWAKVVLRLNLSVSPGNQFDRTATIGLGRSTIYFGTTAEPTSKLGPGWYVERDLTDLSTLFRVANTGQISIGNLVNSTYTSALHGAATVQFYPPDTKYPAPRVADLVLPLADNNGNPVGLATTSSTLAASLAPPRNVESAFIDVMAQSQSNDEFWYTCFPDNLATKLDNCGNGSFRETEVAVDSKPAGVAPIYPWVYTGGIDPFLWAPIPGVQTLNFVPYRVDLTPFAGTLDDGKVHTVSLSVFDADSYFSVTGNLLLFLDRGAKGPLSGAVDSDNLSATPAVAVKEGGAFDTKGSGVGTIDTESTRYYTITGHLNTSHGLVQSKVSNAIAFTQHQNVATSGTEFEQAITQNTSIVSESTTTSGATSDLVKTTFAWPFYLYYAYVIKADGSASQRTVVNQGYTKAVAGPNGFSSISSDNVPAEDTLNFNSLGKFTGPSGTISGQNYTYSDSTGACYGRRLVSANNVLGVTRPIHCVSGH